MSKCIPPIPPEVRERAVRMVLDQPDEHGSQYAAIRSIAAPNFTRYGMIDARVISVSRDADDAGVRGLLNKQEESSSFGPSGDPDHDPSRDGGQGSGYVARIALDHSEMEVDGRMDHLKPGLSVTAEILTGRRRVISYSLSPLNRYSEESGRER